ncbi:hypothetical protein H0A61_02303 [Koleobacter methoxysyntrophicus]|jgi:hypothetical protein|uniref:Uncharacterized protein n=1 Tax=Koleobacter methoxysyntrophicus TaxID=2751313 RepID=A0A8A0RPT7_9FIRM|nr:hypothetical protein [Koleobacter methoxysyntrophicus]MDI3540504.1 hypothetical protein [Thermosediminibacterales bacterium]MDK2901646.1 hypothetical protein [Thermosediminibacterales bacterium]QSQ09922.1 hypothetical protein H0A61_02303 [Koleobacter methoxysyntrophicus]
MVIDVIGYKEQDAERILKENGIIIKKIWSKPPGLNLINIEDGTPRVIRQLILEDGLVEITLAYFKS